MIKSEPKLFESTLLGSVKLGIKPAQNHFCPFSVMPCETECPLQVERYDVGLAEDIESLSRDYRFDDSGLVGNEAQS